MVKPVFSDTEALTETFPFLKRVEPRDLEKIPILLEQAIVFTSLARRKKYRVCDVAKKLSEWQKALHGDFLLPQNLKLKIESSLNGVIRDIFLYLLEKKDVKKGGKRRLVLSERFDRTNKRPVASRLFSRRSLKGQPFVTDVIKELYEILYPYYRRIPRTARISRRNTLKPTYPQSLMTAISTLLKETLKIDITSEDIKARIQSYKKPEQKIAYTEFLRRDRASGM